MKKHYISLFVALFSCVASAFASVPQGYYNNADGKKSTDLKSALTAIISQHKVLGYSKLWEYYPWTYYHLDDPAKVFDMYSDEVRYYNSTAAVTNMNKEHTVPKSWWGGSTDAAPGNDLYNVIPSDATANNRKSNHSLGKVATQTWTNGVTTVGTGTVNGYSETFFEPCDRYKGDFARIYLYMAVCYPDIEWDANNADAMTNGSALTLKDWIIPMLLEWAAADPVDASEIQRNEDVAAVQGNRNPFIDYPILAEYIWGAKTNENFSLSEHIANEGTSTTLYTGVPLFSLVGGTVDAPVETSIGTTLEVKAGSDESVLFTRINDGEWVETRYNVGTNPNTGKEFREAAVKTFTIDADTHIEAYCTQEGRESSAVVSYYYKAVNFADSYLLYEDFASVTGGDNQSTSGSSTAWTGNDNFPIVSTVYQAGNAVRLSSSKNAGSLTSKEMPFAGGNVNVTISVKGWSKIEAPLTVTMTGAEAQTVNYTSTIADDFETVKLSFQNVSANPTINISCTKRAFLNSVVVEDASNTAIGDVANKRSEVSAFVYNLSGQKVGTGYKGLMIKNGRKYISK